MNEQMTKMAAGQPKVSLDPSRLRTLVYRMACEHLQLREPLLKVATAGGVLAANPSSAEARGQARDAWHELLEIVVQHAIEKDDEELVESAEKLKLLPEPAAEAMLAVCNRLKELEFEISQINFEHSPPELVARAGQSMNRFAVTLDDLAGREDHELLPRLQRLLYEHSKKA